MVAQDLLYRSGGDPGPLFLPVCIIHFAQIANADNHRDIKAIEDVYMSTVSPSTL